jgi:hypothetical protein
MSRYTEHMTRAEEILNYRDELMSIGSGIKAGDATDRSLLRAAKVHATLALAAATAGDKGP